MQVHHMLRIYCTKLHLVASNLKQKEVNISEISVLTKYKELMIHRNSFLTPKK